MFPWWPKELRTDLILPLRSLGKRGLRHGAVMDQKHTSVNPDGTLGPKVSVPFAQRRMIWDGTLTLAEKRALHQLARSDVAYVLGRTLADGPKIFKMPGDLLDGLNQIEIPLAVKDFSPPFPTCIVEHPNGEYHFVVFKDDQLSIMVFLDSGGCDWQNMLIPDRLIEDYFHTGVIYEHHSVPQGDLQIPIATDDQFICHRFRATLNFLLLATAEAQFSVQRVPSKHHRKLTHIQKAACPDVYVMQNIKMFQPRTQTALTLPHQGGTKRPHLRRSHWRRVPVGKGRTDRKLTLFPWTFVNKARLSDPDSAKTSYSAG